MSLVSGYQQTPSGWFKLSDGSGPYALDSSGNANLIGGTATVTLTAANTRTGAGDTNIYAAGDLVANSTVAGSVVAMSFTAPRSGTVTGCKCSKTGTGVTAAGQRIHLFTGTAPTVTNGDNGVFLPNRAAGWLGALDVSSFKAFSDGAVGEGLPSVRTVIAVPAAGTISALQESLGAYTPVSAEVFTWSLDFLPD